MKYSRPLNNWTIHEETVDGRKFFDVVHYVGGEEAYVDADWFHTKEEAIEAVKKLNKSGASFEWQMYEGEAVLRFDLGDYIY